MNDINYCVDCDQVKCANCGTLVPEDSVYSTEIGYLCFDCCESSGYAVRGNVEFSYAAVDTIKPLVF